MPSVKVFPGEPFERAYRRFKKAVQKSEILDDLRKYEFYEKPSMKNKRRRAAAVKRQQRLVENAAPVTGRVTRKPKTV